MRRKLLVSAIMLAYSILGFSQKTANMEKIDIRGFYSNPMVSPNGNYVLLTGEHYDGIYLLNLDNKEVIQITDSHGSGYGYSWNNNSETFYFKQKGVKDYNADAKVYSYSLGSKKTILMQGILPNYLPSFNGFDDKRKSNSIVYTNTTTLKIEAKDLVSGKIRIITKDEGQFYNAIASHDGSRIAVHNGADIYVYEINGTGKGIKIGTGLATSWSADDSFIIGFLDESADGHTVDNSELYLFNTSTYKPVKLTDTKEIAEMFPSFIGNDSLLFSDDKTGELYKVNLKL